ncbi:MAG: exo-alpha-sialidase [Alistipes sp.]|nr:exo-alpha-sialidase [Alistipes sp.]
MRKNFLLHIALMLLMGAVAMGCEKGPAEDNTTDPTQSITLAMDSYAVGEKGGNFSLPYVVDGLEEGVSLVATSDAEWLSALSAKGNTLKFHVDNNLGEERRRDDIKISVEGKELATLHIEQCAAPLRFEVFETRSTADVPYRIPAIAVTPQGTIVCAADYRHSYKDIGVVENGRIDLHARRSHDNGASWDALQVIINGKGAESEDFMNVGYGDPCLVADRVSGRLLLLSCAGNVRFQDGTRKRHQNIARFYSDDDGASWSEPEDIAESIYSQFDASPYGPVKAMFVASGRIMQSRTTKVNEYYRLYCSVLVRDVNDNYTNYKNFVLYSDDFGGSWSILGGANKAAITTADEAKVEELPNGSILISSRTNGGRYYNIYDFDNVEAATGKWQTQSFSGWSNSGVSAKDNSTNGEIMLLDVVRQADGKVMQLLLQSVPLGPGRSNVGVYYKGLEDDSDYVTSELVAKSWEGVLQLTTRDSAYSTMTLQNDGNIALLWEEATHCAGGDGYTIVYGSYSVEQITNNAYRIL